MNFLQAHAAVKAFQGGPQLRFALACSAVTATLDLYLRAHAAQAGREAQIDTLPFDGVAQYIRGSVASESPEVFLLLPWDLLQATNWRTGIAPRSLVDSDVHASLAEHTALFARRSTAAFLYIAAPLPPVMATVEQNRALEATLLAAAHGLGARILPASCFNLAGYLESGNPFASQHLGAVAEAIIASALARKAEPKKVLVTDLDNTLWSGVIGEDGLDGIAHAPEGRGYRYFVYQSLLRKLRNEGTVLAAVSRNDPALALGPFARGDMVLQESDFVAIIASYNSKSAQIAQLASDLNLGLDSFVFVDDNPIEIEEVRLALPKVECVTVPREPAALHEFLLRLQELFGKAVISEEDTKRTQMYRARASGSVPSEAHGADLRKFLESLQMTLTIRERRIGDHARCLQLINKTNQFNLNGRRLTEEQIRETLEQGGHLIGASLDDRNGSHGEVIACLLDSQGTIQAFVMSCRVFQRRAEYAFVAWLASQPFAPNALSYAVTERNEPVRMFLQAALGSAEEGIVTFAPARLREAFADDLTLFKLVEA